MGSVPNTPAMSRKELNKLESQILRLTKHDQQDKETQVVQILNELSQLTTISTARAVAESYLIMQFLIDGLMSNNSNITQISCTVIKSASAGDVEIELAKNPKLILSLCHALANGNLTIQELSARCLSNISFADGVEMIMIEDCPHLIPKLTMRIQLRADNTSADCIRTLANIASNSEVAMMLVQQQVIPLFVSTLSVNILKPRSMSGLFNMLCSLDVCMALSTNDCDSILAALRPLIKDSEDIISMQASICIINLQRPILGSSAHQLINHASIQIILEAAVASCADRKYRAIWWLPQAFASALHNLSRDPILCRQLCCPHTFSVLLHWLSKWANDTQTLSLQLVRLFLETLLNLCHTGAHEMLDATLFKNILDNVDRKLRLFPKECSDWVNARDCVEKLRNSLIQVENDDPVAWRAKWSRNSSPTHIALDFARMDDETSKRMALAFQALGYDVWQREKGSQILQSSSRDVKLTMSALDMASLAVIGSVRHSEYSVEPLSSSNYALHLSEIGSLEVIVFESAGGVQLDPKRRFVRLETKTSLGVVEQEDIQIIVRRIVDLFEEKLRSARHYVSEGSE
eukprot:c14332_g1_i1.p1 GENE.c14332_g1_i1~~c14332_g1_i1.p1  ORF type:complete len:577 (+),score=109.15 c14332_g1_i1:3-1733(+)